MGVGICVGVGVAVGVGVTSIVGVGVGVTSAAGVQAVRHKHSNRARARILRTGNTSFHLLVGADGVDIHHRGRIFGLLGRNGDGVKPLAR